MMTSSVIGIDLGSSTSYVARVENGGVVVLTNEINSRTTPTILSLPSTDRGTRMVGASAESQLVTHPNSAVAEVTGLLGASTVDLRDHRDCDKLEQGRVHLIYAGRQRRFQAEQLVGTVLKHLKKIVPEGPDNSCYYVLSAPNYFTDAERSALLDAATIADMKIHQLTNDLTAAALAYGYFQKHLPQAALLAPVHPTPSAPDLRLSAPPLGDRPRLVVFVDFGHSGIQTGLVAFAADGLKMLTTQTDRTVGGRHFDRRLADHFVDMFNAQHASKGVAISRKSHPKAYAKLLSVAEKMKRQMSANRNVLPVEVECLAEDLDLRTDISREVFETLCQDLFDKVRKCFVRLLQRSQLERDSLHSVEILGGSSRIPRFKSTVEEVFAMQPSTTLNADEAVARGCALMCALNTKVFKVKPFLVIDTIHYTTQVKYASIGQQSNSTAMVPARQRNAQQDVPILTQTKVVFSKNSPNPSQEAYIELEEIPQGNTLALEYCYPGGDDVEHSECEDLKMLTKKLIAIYNFQFDVPPLEGDKLQLRFTNDFGGIVQLRWAKQIHATKRVKYDDANPRERPVKFSEVRVGGLTDKDLDAFIQDEISMEDNDGQERLREETKNRLEEFSFSLRDELEGLGEVVQREEAWTIISKYVWDLCNSFETEEYDSASLEFYRGHLDEVQKKKKVFMIWLHKFNQKLELENLCVRRK